MTTAVTVIIVVLVVAALAAAAFVMFQKQRRSQLQQRFGPEYDRAVEGADSRRAAESHLAGVAQQRDKLDLRDLDEAEQARYRTEWDGIQARFVDEPGSAVDSADTLLTTVMRVRGYPVEDFDQRADLVAADHPEVVSHYREANAAHERHRSTGGVDTEDLRQSFVHYRALFAVLVEDPDLDRSAVNRTNAAAEVDRTEVDPADVDPADVDSADVDRADVDAAAVDRTEVDRTRIDRAEDHPAVDHTDADLDRPVIDRADRVDVADPETEPSHPQETR